MAKNVYSIVNEKVLKMLENGVKPWVKPWIYEDMPFNIKSGKTYSILNCLCLSQSGPYATFKQWNELGGKVKKGSKSEIICFWNFTEKGTGKFDKDGKEIMESIPILKHYNVFNIRSIEFPKGAPKKVQIELDKIEKNHKPNFEHNKVQKAEDVLRGYAKREGIKIYHRDNDKACYVPSDDYVIMPEMYQFPTVGGYYATQAHELVHSTGHAKRLNRGLRSGFGSAQYGREELVAEMGSAYLMALLGIETDQTIENSASYIDNWRKAIEEDEKAIVVAAGKAQKAVEYILGMSLEDFSKAQ